MEPMESNALVVGAFPVCVKCGKPDKLGNHPGPRGTEHTFLIRESFSEIKPNDYINRVMGGHVFMTMVVTQVDEKFIYCGRRDLPISMKDKDQGWKFSRKTGMEHEEDLGWDDVRSGTVLICS